MGDGTRLNRSRKKHRTNPLYGLLICAACAIRLPVDFVLAPGAAQHASQAALSPVPWQRQRLERQLEPSRVGKGTWMFLLAATALGLKSSLGVVRRSRHDAQEAMCKKTSIIEPLTCSMGTCSTRLKQADDPLARGVRSSAPLLPVSISRRSPKTSVTRNLLMPLNIQEKKPRKPLVKPFRHCTKWKFRGYDLDNNKPYFGKYALQARDEAWISSKCIETVRRVIVRTMARKGKSWIRIFPDQGITQRVAESRMGAGKGALDHWVKAVRPGQILFEIDGVSEEIALLAFHRAKFRLACKTGVVIKTDGPSRFELGLEGETAVSKEDRARMAAAKKAAAMAAKKLAPKK